MKDEFMILCLIIPRPEHPGIKLNVMLEPLIQELKELWAGVEAYDTYKKQKFKLRAAYLWSIHDFLAYGIFAGWRVNGRLACPICGKETDCFRLNAGGKFVTSIIIGVFFLWTTPSGSRHRSLGRTPLSRRDHHSAAMGGNCRRA